MSEGLDSEVPPEFRSLVPQDDLQSGGRSTMLAASADYARNRRRVQLFGTASTLLQICPGASIALPQGVRAHDWEPASACRSREVCEIIKRPRILRLTCISCFRRRHR